MLSFDAWGTEATHFLHEWRGEHKGVTIPLHTSAIEGLWNILRRTGVGDARYRTRRRSPCSFSDNTTPRNGASSPKYSSPEPGS
jgi:hypothetical protein